MRDRVSMLIAALLLLLVTVTSYWYAREMRRPTAGTAPTPGTPDFVVDRVVLTQFGRSGEARYKLFAEQMSHFNENDDIAVVKPRLVSLEPGQPQVQVSSARALVTNAGERVQMRGDVVVRRAAAGTEPALTIHSEALTALPDEERFISEVPAVIERGDMRLSGSAMVYDNLKRELTVTGGLRGELAPAGG